MEIRPLAVDGAYEIIPQVFSDERGSFITAYDDEFFTKQGLCNKWIADNQSFNVCRGTLRGLHFQKYPSSQIKYVRALVGRVFDVLVDLRPSSPTYLKWDSVVLDSSNGNGIYIPKGCAHGYVTLEDGCVVGYKVDTSYDREREGGFRWDDPAFRIVWPHLENSLILSPKDKSWQDFNPDLNPFRD